jgi:hypothetical protein
VARPPALAYLLLPGAPLTPDRLEMVTGEAARRIQVAGLEDPIEAGVAARRGDQMHNADCSAQFHSAIIRVACHQLVERVQDLLAPQRWLLAPAGADWVGRH